MSKGKNLNTKGTKYHKGRTRTTMKKQSADGGEKNSKNVNTKKETSPRASQPTGSPKSKNGNPMLGEERGP